MKQAITGHHIPLNKGCVKEISYQLLKEWIKLSGIMTEEGLIPIEKSNLVKMLQGLRSQSDRELIAEAVAFIEAEIKDEMEQAEEKAVPQLKLTLI